MSRLRSLFPQKNVQVQVRTDLCAKAASCGNVSDLQKALEPMADDTTFLDSCLEDLSAKAVQKGHLSILQYLATCKPPESWSTNICSLAAKQGQLQILQWAHSAGCLWDAETLQQACIHRQWAVLDWLQHQDIPCPPATDDRVCDMVAALGKTDLLVWLRMKGYAWTADTAYSALANQQFELHCWLRNQQPPCPWIPLQERGDNHKHPSESHNTATQMQQKLEEILFSFLKFRLSTSMGQAKREFLDSVLMEMLAAQKPCLKLMESAVGNVSAAGHLGGMRWMQQHYPAHIVWHRKACMAAVLGDRTVMLALLQSSNPPCPWEPDECIEAAVRYERRHVLAWFQTQGHASVLGCLCAAKHGNLHMLKLLRGRDPPWPWDSSVCEAASRQPKVLHWLLTQEPPCPMTAEDTAKCCKALGGTGDVDLIKKLNLPIQDMPDLLVGAAKYGCLGLLKWLVQQQPPCPLTPNICRIAAQKNPELLHFVLSKRPDVKMFSAFEVNWMKMLRPANYLLLAQAGCPMPKGHLSNVIRLVESWYFFMGLYSWAVNQPIRSQTTPHSSSNCNTHECPLCQPSLSQLHMPQAALTQLARLPADVAARIASEAFLSPQQADKICFRSTAGDGSSDSDRSDQDVLDAADWTSICAAVVNSEL
ncbi:hypothetical protein WJX74_001482 [Apatococcus lobatus]|uniref:Ankyrin repeat domain-containing protein n=1 Tax=Apatococcus lobatus TaxID=904363 RepID=A0AAW1QA06_9CHLO